MALIEEEYYGAIRGALDADLVTDRIVTNARIEDPNNLPMSELLIRERIDDLSDITADDSLDDVQSSVGYTDDQILKLKTAIIYHVAAKLAISFTARTRISAGEMSEDFAEKDWKDLAACLLDESNKLVDELNDDEDELDTGARFSKAKSSRSVNNEKYRLDGSSYTLNRG